MSALKAILSELDQRNLAMKIGSVHDRTRMQYRFDTNTIGGFDEFSKAIGDYYNHHFAICNSNGGKLSEAEACQAAREIVENYYRHKTRGNIVNAYNDAREGTNGGMRVILDMIADDLKMRSIERHIQQVFDRYVAPNSWEDKVAIIRQFIDTYGELLSGSIDRANPERYAQDFHTLIRQIVQTMEQTSHVLRRQ
jgi:hypothetical protein